MKPAIKRKDEKVKSLSENLKKYKVIAVINLEGLGSSQLQRLRRDLKSSLMLEVTTKNNMVRALKNSKVKGLDKLADSIKGVCGLGLTNDNPFKLSIKLKQMTTPTVAKSGQIAPFDLIVNKGPTSFTPGPVISELSDLGIKTKVEAGKLSIMSDVVLVKAGGEITQAQAGMMARLGMTPMRRGLNLVSAYEAGSVFPASELIINVIDYGKKTGLSFSSETPIIEVMNALIGVAVSHVRNLSINAGLITKENSKDLLMIANAKARALADRIKWEVK